MKYLLLIYRNEANMLSASKATADKDPFHYYQVCFKNCLRKRPTWTEFMCDEYCRSPRR